MREDDEDADFEESESEEESDANEEESDANEEESNANDEDGSRDDGGRGSHRWGAFSIAPATLASLPKLSLSSLGLFSQDREGERAKVFMDLTFPPAAVDLLVKEVTNCCDGSISC